MTRQDTEELARLRHPDWSARWPQSGELVRRSEDERRIMEAYPGGSPKLLEGRVVGLEDQWITSPMGGAYRVEGGGENWWGEWLMDYPDGKRWHTIALVEMRDGKVWRETTYWAEPFEAPEWRRPFVDHLETTS